MESCGGVGFACANSMKKSCTLKPSPLGWEPAPVLIGNKVVELVCQPCNPFLGAQTIRTSDLIGLLQLLQRRSHSDFYEFVQVAGGDGKKLHSFEERVGFI